MFSLRLLGKYPHKRTVIGIHKVFSKLQTPNSKIKVILSLIILISVAWASWSILITPYDILNQRSDRYPVFYAYVFFGIALPVCVLKIMLLVYELFRKGAGLYLTESGVIDNTSPLSIGDIPFERIITICDATNIVSNYKRLKFRRNEIQISLRDRKVDRSWWEGKGFRGRLFKRFNSTNCLCIQTTVLSSSRQEVVEAIEKHVQSCESIRMYAMDYEKTEKYWGKKRNDKIKK